MCRISRHLPFALAGLLLTVVSFPLPVQAQDAPSRDNGAEQTRAFSFSRLIFRPQDQEVIAVTDDQTRVLTLEYFRKLGFNAVGAENLVFATDHASDAELALGGTIRYLKCSKGNELHHCVMGINWELLDISSNRVIYKATVYGQVHQKGVSSEAALRVLIETAIDSLAKKKKLHHLLAEREGSENEQSSNYPQTNLASCTVDAVRIDKNGEQSLDALVIVEQENSFGSGFFLSDGPFLLTAAHVVAGSSRPLLKFRNGHQSRASVIRVDSRADVALLRVDEAPRTHTCLRPADTKKNQVGAPVFALGSPASQELAFSMSKGIISGVRIVRGLRQIQTDASINPGNSGGPLMTADGTVLGITSWKLAGGAVEGLGFASSIHDALEILGVRMTEQTSTALTDAPAVTIAQGHEKSAYIEPADSIPILDPGSDRENAIQERRKELTPVMAPILRWGGLGLAVGGAGLIAYSAILYDGRFMSTTHYQTARLLNDIGWVAAGAGGAAFLVSFALVPSRKKAEESLEANVGTTVSAGIYADASIGIRGSF